jgi:mannose-6-phosphate isomerase-like protein (cupin superfamily)
MDKSPELLPWATFEVAGLAAARREGGRPYHEFLRVAEMSAGLYELPAGGVDRQEPHAEDEIYVVVAGRARFQADGEETDVGPGSVLYVRAGVDHRFHSITEPLQVLVVFAPPETSP